MDVPWKCMMAFVAALAAVPQWAAAAEASADYPVRPVAFTEVKIDDGFWAARLATSRDVTIPTCLDRCEETGRIDNFAVAGGLMEGFYRGARYNDSDVYKVLEGAAYLLSVHAAPELGKRVDDVIAKIAAAQEDDGYLSTLRTITPELDIAKTRDTPQHQLDMYGKPRWARCDHGHELYCVGHMYEAAVAHHLATGKRALLDVALRNADLICRTFGPNPGQIRNVPGHQEIEIGLVKLYRLTGEKKYLDMAKFFLDERGHYNGRTVHSHKESITYCQDDKPVVEQREPHGHVVRAVYMYSAMADIAALTHDARYARAVDRIWQNIVSKRLYLIGSMGVHGYLEGFGPNYVLPNLQAYNETCATVGTAFLNLRLFLLHRDAKYI
ncbi:MAG: glycoside hydrolase family 127 protein, partial [Armatimonadota bacterium]